MKKYCKSLIILFYFLSLSTFLFSQGVVISETSGATPDSDAILDIQSTTQGILIPRMTTIQRNNLTDASTPDGLLIYDTTVGAFKSGGTHLVEPVLTLNSHILILAHV